MSEKAIILKTAYTANINKDKLYIGVEQRTNKETDKYTNRQWDKQMKMQINGQTEK